MFEFNAEERRQAVRDRLDAREIGHPTVVALNAGIFLLELLTSPKKAIKKLQRPENLRLLADKEKRLTIVLARISSGELKPPRSTKVLLRLEKEIKRHKKDLEIEVS